MSEKKFNVPWWVSTVFGVIIVVGGIVFGLLFEKLNITNVLMAIILVVLSAITGAIVARLTASQRLTESEENLQGKFNALEKNISNFQNEIQKIIDKSTICQNCANTLYLSIKTVKEVIEGKFGEALITYEDLIQIEGSVNPKGEIWVLTSALQLEEVELKEVIYNNFKKGIKYKYFIPEEDLRLQKRMRDLANKWQQDCELSVDEAKEQIQCYIVPKHFAYMTVIVYDPYKEPPTVLVKFPTSEFYEKEKYPLVYRVDTKPKEAWSVFVDSLQELMAESKRCPHTKRLTIDFSDNAPKSKR